MERDADTAAQPPGRRPSSKLHIKQEGRKPLIPGAGAREDAPKDDDKARPNLNPRRLRPGGAAGDASWWRANSDSQAAPALDRRDSNGSVTSPGGTRLPRPKSGAASSREPVSLKKAFELAASEDDSEHSMPDGSPSPAPRTWHARAGSDGRSVRKMLEADHLDTKGRNRKTSGVGGDDSGRRPSETSERIRGPFSNSKLPSRTLDAGRESAKATGNEGNWRELARESSKLPKEGLFGGIPDLVPGIEDVPLPSVEGAQEGFSSPLRQASGNENPSPEKSFGWLEQDFTGEIQVSDSPRIKVNQPFANRRTFNENSDIDLNSRTRLNPPGSQNTKLDEIRSREAKNRNGSQARQSPKQSNTRLDDIRARERRAEQEIPLSSRRLPAQSQNGKLDEISQRESNPLSNRALSLARLSDIKEQNALSRSLSPDERPRSSQAVHHSTPETKIPVRSKSAFEAAGERIPDTPITVYKNRQDRRTSSNDEGRPKGRNGSGSPLGGTSHVRSDSRDVLRQLARATSASPAPETQGREPPKNERVVSDRSDSRARTAIRKTSSGRKTNPESKEPETTRRTVGFAGLRRVSSSESTKSKRSSMHSENDPEDRIVGEMALFAPQDNHSERGSIRAPSPQSEEEVEATPKPKKQDPLSMPTPRVTGAYVETPATVRVDKPDAEKPEPKKLDLKKPDPKIEIEEPSDADEGWKESGKKESSMETKPKSSIFDLLLPDTKAFARRSRDQDVDLPTLPIDLPALPEKISKAARGNRDDDTASDPGTADTEKDDPIAASAAARRPRARSLPRRRPPLRNSAKPPSVKDDLLELQRTHNIDDSTLDDLDEVLSGRKAASPKFNALLKHLPDSDSDESLKLDLKSYNEPKDTTTTNKKISELEKSKNEVDNFERMDKKLLRAMSGTSIAKHGIERMEDEVSNGKKATPDTMAVAETKHAHTHEHLQCPACAAHPNPSAVAYIHLPVPRLYHRTPHFRLTVLGLIVALLSFWGAAESAMCATYCRPDACTSPPCVWSFDDPSFGTALPVKTDQWITGGYGREVLNSVIEEAEDWAADMMDAAYGRDLTDVDTNALTFHQKRQHKRRLRKKGLVKDRVESPEQRAKWDSWHQTRLAKERAREAREMGYAVEDTEEDFSSDQRIW